MASTAAIAANKLKKAEQGATSAAPTFYSGTGKSKDASTGKGKIKGKLKQKVALITILLTLAGGGVFLSSSHSLLGPALSSQLTSATDFQYTSNSIRGANLFNYYLKGQEITTENWYGAKRYTAMSTSFKNRLKNNGIEVEGYLGNRKLVYTNSTTGVSTEIPASDFNKVYRNDPEFRNAYNRSTRGRVASFFDSVANKIYQRLGISRNLYGESDYRNTGDADADTDSYRRILTDEFDGDTSTVKIENSESKTKDQLDSDGNKIPDGNGGYKQEEVIETKTDTEVSKTSTIDSGSSKSKAIELVDGISGKITAAGNFACAAYRVGATISMMVAAAEIYTSINYFLKQMEPISASMAGYGDSTPINPLLNFLTTPTNATVDNYNDVSVTGSLGGEDLKATVGTISYDNKAPIDGNLTNVLAGTSINKSLSSQFSFERVSNSFLALFAAGTNLRSAQTICNAAGITFNLVSLGLSAISLGTFSIVSSIVSLAKGAAISIAVGTALSFMIPAIASSLMTNAIEDATGIKAGEYMLRGASAANSKLARSGSGLVPSNADAILSFNHATNEVLALDAEVDRLNHSPFDITNKNTFLGSIAYSFIPFMRSSALSGVSSLLTTTSSSIASLLGSAHADGEDSSYAATHASCKNLESIGAVGDAYCNTSVSISIDTLNISPNDQDYQDEIAKNMVPDSCGEDGYTCEIKGNSDLAKFIRYVANRESPDGIIDQNILAENQIDSGANIAVSSILGATPFVGDIIDIINNASELENLDWADGSRCVDNPDNPYRQVCQYYALYVTDMRLLEQRGAFVEETETGEIIDHGSPVSNYIAKYEEEHPVDNSTVGYLSRISGLTPENTKTTLAFVEYYYYINSYDPTTRIASSVHHLADSDSSATVAKLQSNKLYIENPTIIHDTPITTLIAKQIVYNDVRNRSFAA